MDVPPFFKDNGTPASGHTAFLGEGVEKILSLKLTAQHFLATNNSSIFKHIKNFSIVSTKICLLRPPKHLVILMD